MSEPFLLTTTYGYARILHIERQEVNKMNVVFGNVCNAKLIDAVETRK